MTKVSKNHVSKYHVNTDISNYNFSYIKITSAKVSNDAVHKYTNFMSASDKEIIHNELRIRAAQLKKAHLSIFSFYDKNGKKIKNRTYWCGQKIFNPANNVSIKRKAKINSDTRNITLRHYYGNLSHCNNVWTCPTCAHIILRRRENKLNNTFGVIKLSNELIMLTLTIYHTKINTCLELVNKLSSAWKAVIESRLGHKFTENFPYWVRAFEVNCSDKTGFHPHYHIVFAKPNTMTKQKYESILIPLLQLWKTKSGNISNNYQGSKLTYYKNEKYLFEINKGITSRELTTILKGKKSGSYDSMYLAEINLERWYDYAKAVRGKQRLRVSDAFKKLSEILDQEQKEDSEIMKENEEFPIIYEFEKTWDIIRKDTILLAKIINSLNNQKLKEFENMLLIAGLKLHQNYSIVKLE